VCFSLCVIIVFFSDCRIYLFSSLAARVFNKLTRYLVYSEADFEVFRPTGATRCTDGGEIWHGGGDFWSPPPCQISPPTGATTRV